MSADHRASSPLVDQRTATVSSAALAARLGRWSQGDATLVTGLAAAVARLVAAGELRPGDRLPSERALAAAVSVSRGTVVGAYAQLAERGVVDRRQGSGTRIAGDPPARAFREGLGDALFRAVPSAIDLLRAVPAIPDEAVRIVRAHAPVIDPVALAEVDPAGLPILRERIARLMSEEGTPTTPEQILVAHGGQQALALLIDELVEPGDVVLTESVTWPGLTDPVRRRGGRVVGVTLNADGVDVDELETAIVTQRPALVALNPHNHNPTGVSASSEVRRRIAELSAAYGVIVLEDRVLAQSTFEGPPPPSLAALRPDAPVIVVESVSKWSWSGLRVGWVRADPVLVRRLRGLRQSVDLSTSVPAQLLALDLIDAAVSLRRSVMQSHAETMAAAVAAVRRHLPGWAFELPRGGFSLWVALPAGSASAFAQVAARHGVAVAGGREFTASDSADDHIRIPYTAPLELLEEGVRRLGQAWIEYSGRLLPG